MDILKFGGTSMGDEHTWRRVLDIINRYKKPIIVVSATARTTRQLVAAGELAKDNLDQALEISQSIKKRHQQLIQSFLENAGYSKKKTIRELCFNRIDHCINALNKMLQTVASTGSVLPATQDAIASIGEQLSANLFAQCGTAYGLNTKWIDAGRIIKTDSNFGQATPNHQKIAVNAKIIRQDIEDGFIPVIGGFFGQNDNGQVTTLGFEGSDYTASLLGAALKAHSVEIWTDVSGIYTCDPNIVKQAQAIPELSFGEATEMACFGAKVLHPSTMKPTASAGIPLFVKNIFEPDHPGTKIHNNKSGNGWAKAITYIDDVTLLTITSDDTTKGHKFLVDLFNLLHKLHVSGNIIATTKSSVTIVLQNEAPELEEQLKALGIVHQDEDKALISVIGCRIAKTKDLTKKIFSAIPETTPSLISYNRNKQNLNIVISKNDVIPAVCSIHRALFENV